MIKRDETPVLYSELMVISDGFVIGDGYETFGFKNSPFKRDLSVPLFYIFKVNEGHPLVLYNNGGSIRVYPKQDFDGLRSKSEPIRFPAQWTQDKITHDLVTFMFVPYDVNDEDIAWKKTASSPEFSLLYAEHGMDVSQSNQRAAHVMPSAVPNYFYDWLHRSHLIESYDDKNHKWIEETTLKISADKVIKITHDVNKLLEERFNMPLLLRRN